MSPLFSPPAINDRNRTCLDNPFKRNGIPVVFGLDEVCPEFFFDPDAVTHALGEYESIPFPPSVNHDQQGYFPTVAVFDNFTGNLSIFDSCRGTQIEMDETVRLRRARWLPQHYRPGPVVRSGFIEVLAENGRISPNILSLPPCPLFTSPL